MKTEIWAAVHTPFFEDKSVDFEGVKKNVEQYVARGIDGLFCNGLFGENWSVNAEERVKIAQAIIDAAKGRLKLCSVATLGTEQETIELGLEYKNIGVDYSCLITPKKKVPDAELIDYFNRLMDGIDMPFTIFNSVTAEGSVLTPAAFAEITRNENVKILKTTVSDEVNNALRNAARPGVLCSDPTEEKFFVNATKNGQKILFADPEPYLYQSNGFRPIEKYISLIEEGNLDAAKVIFDGLAPLRKQYNKWFLTPFYQGIMTMAYLKKFAEIVGLVGGAVRDPLTPVPKDEALQMETEIKAAFRKVKETLGEELV